MPEATPPAPGRAAPVTEAQPRLTSQQAAAVARAAAGADGRVVARAGTGKTATLVAMAEAANGAPGLYLAFNRAIAAEARGRFPPHVRVTTLHALAHRAIVAKDPAYRRKFDRGGGRLDTPTLVRLAGLADAPPADAARYAAQVRATLAGFCASEAARVSPEHVPVALRTELAATLPADRLADRFRWLARRAQRAWTAVRDRDDPAPLDFDAFLKLYQLRRPRWPEAVAWVDEAQDLNPVMLALLRNQDAQRILVGDPEQQIYGWRGAVNALDAFPFPVTRLTRSFRFGERVAAVAERVLAVLSDHPEVRGEGGPDEVTAGGAPGTAPVTVLCRTHAGLIDAALTLGRHGVHVVGGIRPLTETLRAAHALRSGRPATHPALHGARTWAEFERLAEAAGGAVRTLHGLAERHAADLPGTIRALERAHRAREDDAPVVLSTMHKAKGREWDAVCLWGDVPRMPVDRRGLAGAPDPASARAELNLLYVAVTRARRTLALGRVPDDVRHLLWPDRGAS